ncbi:hypothetical protein D3C81_188080 [compost metagenome]|uniref:hypothetical protein n=1 Tax=Scandinavium manionii TaxID=2926520 RepID=UPI000FA03143|nr:hypothetical protein [Scandinavium manionii]MCS2164435.1 hypothetical protein [Scandinavium manionii]
MTTISQKSAREMLGTPEQFRGGVYVTKNGAAELFIQTAEERDAELAERNQQQQVNAMLKLVSLSQHDVEQGHFGSARELLARRRAEQED